VKLTTLRKRVQSVTKVRGHRMRWGIPYGRSGGPKSQRGECRVCGQKIVLNEPPTAALVDGTAARINCGAITLENAARLVYGVQRASS
jgi:hypothetical protein